jgi:hypothetical protein
MSWIVPHAMTSKPTSSEVTESGAICLLYDRAEG